MDIPEPVLKRLLAVFVEEASIDKVYLFGSRARGDHRYNSDIDLALQGNKIKPTVYLQIKEAAGLYKVDIVNLSDQLDEGFLEEFEQDAVLIYEKETLATSL